MGLFNPDNKLIKLLERAFDVFLIGILWLIGAFTIIGIGPVTTAAYYAIAKSVRRGRGSLLSEFFRALKENFIKSTVVWIILLVLGIFVYLTDYNYIVEILLTRTTSNLMMLILAILKVFLLLGINTYIFPILSRFNVKLPKAILVSIGLMFRHFFLTLVMIVLFFCAVLISIAVPVVCWIVPGIYLLLLSFPMEAILRKYVDPKEAIATDENDPWYMDP